jgi:hypothetical protein
MKQLHISPDLALPIGIANKTILLFGKGGSGKSNLEVALAEELYASGIPTCIVDPADIHYGIKSARDGKSAGLPFIVFGGLHADVPIFPENGALLADLFLDRGLYMVIVTQPWTGSERTRFMTAFANQLYKRGPEKEQRGSARVLMLEEAHEYVPLSPGKGEEEMLGAMKRLYTVGRNYWIGFIAATRRPAKMHTDLRNGADATAFFQIVGTQDRKAMQDYLGENAPEEVRREILTHLAKLPVGTAYFYQPDQDPSLRRLKFRYRDTLDTTTTEITAGHKVIKPVLAEVDLTKLGDAMAAAREKAKADDPRELRKRIAELERQLHQRINDAKKQLLEIREVEKVVRVEVPVYPDSVRDWLRETASSVDGSATELQKLAKMLRDGAGMKVSAADRMRRDVVAEDLVTSSRAPALSGRIAQPHHLHGSAVEGLTPPSPPARTSARSIPAAPNGHRDQGADFIGGKVTGPQQRILDGLAWAESVRIPSLDKVQLALLADASPKSSAYANNLGALRSAGLITKGGPVALTEEGRAVSHINDTPPTTEALQQTLMSRLAAPQARILQVLIEAYPADVEREALADRSQASSTSSAFANNLGRLRSLGLISKSGPITALPVLFLEEAARR